MRAIYGVLGQVTEKEIAGMATRILHRGKHQTAKRPSNEVFFGSGSHNNRSNEIFTDGRYTVVADASIYNRDELKLLLGRSDAQLATDDNEEIILSLYKSKDIAGLNDINGDFAFAIWDQTLRQLILGRDYFGCYPLYYAILSGGRVAFASEYKALLALSGAPSEPDFDMIQHLQHCKRLPIGRTLLRGIYSVPPGSLLVLNEKGVQVRQEQMPKLALNIDHCSEKEASRKVKDALFSAIECRVGQENTIGIALGGGIDSIGMVCICRKLYPNAEIHTFTAGYGDNDNDLLNASRVAQAMNTIHHEVSSPPGLLKTSLPRLVWHLEDPYSRSESLQLYEVAREARKFVPTLLSAQGADGLFGGMPKYQILSYMSQAKILKGPLEEFYNLTQTGVKPQSLLGRTFDALYFRGRVPSVPRVIGTSYYPDPITFPKVTEQFVNHMLVNGFQVGVCQDVQKFDRGFAASGVGYRSPFYDRRVIETAYSISDELKIKGQTQKYIFRRALDGVVPVGLLNVPKFPQRMNYDLEFSNVLDELSASYLSKENVEKRGFFRFSDIQRLIRHNTTKPYSAEGAMRVWTALLTEIWAIEFLDKKGGGSEALQAGSEPPYTEGLST